jgi:hypothetical protein
VPFDPQDKRAEAAVRRADGAVRRAVKGAYLVMAPLAPGVAARGQGCVVSEPAASAAATSHARRGAWVPRHPGGDISVVERRDGRRIAGEVRDTRKAA